MRRQIEASGVRRDAASVKQEGKLAGRKHHDLLAWQISIQLVSDIYKLTAGFPTTEQYGLTAQLRRAAVSIPSNIAEGAARSTKKEFLHFLTMARGSLSEIDTQLVIAKQLGYSFDDTPAQESLDRTFGLLGGLMRSVGKGQA